MQKGEEQHRHESADVEQQVEEQHDMEHQTWRSMFRCILKSSRVRSSRLSRSRLRRIRLRRSS